jgi:DsbC/DsbD-like thiol-disulfide interchange protein
MKAAAALLAVLALWPVPPAVAESVGGPIGDAITAAAILPGWRAADGRQIAALQVTLAPGWKTYWRSPGDAGIPPRFDWTGSENVAAVTIRWPAPEIFDLNGLRVIGYAHDVVLPFEITPRTPGAPVRVRGAVDLGVCETVCIPASLTFDTVLGTGADPDLRIAAAIDSEPRVRPAGASCALDPIRDGMRLTAGMDLPRMGPEEFAVIEVFGTDIWVSTPEAAREGARLTLTADLVPPSAQPFALERDRLRFTVFGGGAVVELQGCGG